MRAVRKHQDYNPNMKHLFNGEILNKSIYHLYHQHEMERSLEKNRQIAQQVFLKHDVYLESATNFPSLVIPDT